jgi:hypothetical protein
MLSEPREQLDKSIESLYSIFATYPLRDPIVACDHCVLPEDHARLRSKPLRDLQEVDLSRYAHKAMTTWGDEFDFRHFLPRLLQLVADGTAWPISVDRIIEYKLNDAQWHRWPEAEQGSIKRYLLALWTYHVTCDDNSDKLQEILISALKAGINVSPYLDVWGSLLPEQIPAVLNLAEFIYTIMLGSDQNWKNYDEAQSSSLDSPYWDDVVVTWLLSPSVKEALLNAIRLPHFSNELPGLNLAMTHLEWLHSIPRVCVSIGY